MNTFNPRGDLKNILNYARCHLPSKGILTAKSLFGCNREINVRFLKISLNQYFLTFVFIAVLGILPAISQSPPVILDMQTAPKCKQHAYVLQAGKTEAPGGLQEALKTGNRLQDILTGNFKTGRSGNEILKASREQAISEGIRPSIYTHPIGFHGHAAGPTIGLWDQQEGMPGKGDYPLPRIR